MLASAMAYKTISIVQDFPQPLSVVFAHLSHHDNLGRVFGMPVVRIAAARDSGEPDGVGSVRRLSLGPIRIEETVTGFEKDRLIEYRVTKGGFMKHHLGTMRFSEHAGGTRLDYTIEVESLIPGFTGPLVKGLDSGIRRGLAGLAKRL
jgi:Polyketide cyclase / dehydrase and lipid transport